MTADVEESVKFIGTGENIGELLGVGPESLLLCEEFGGSLVGLEHLDGGRVQRGLAALGGGDGQRDLFMEDFPGVGELGLIHTNTEKNM